MMKRIVFTLFVLILLASAAHSQSRLSENDLGWHEEDRITMAMQNFLLYHKYRFGILRYQPRLSLKSGSDGNATFGDVPDDSSHRESDYFASAVPGISAGLKLGSSAYFRILQDFNFIYYFHNQNRSGIYGNSLAEFVTGNSQLLATFRGSYYRKSDTVNQEVDEPVEHKNTSGNAIVEYSIGQKIDVINTFRAEEIKFVASQDVIDSGIRLTDRRELSALAAFGYALKHTLRLRVDANIRRSVAITTDVNTDTIELLGGFDTKRERLDGLFLTGVGRTRVDDESSKNLFLLEGRVDYRFRPTFVIGAYVYRRTDYSVLSDTATIARTEAGPRFQYQFAKPLYIDGHYTFGKNDYGDTIVQGVVVNHDTYQDGEIGFRIETYRKIFLRPGIRYHKRDTDIPGFTKSNLYYFVDFGIGYTFNF